MKILFFCPLWGSETIPFDLFCERVAEAGYDGVELSFPLGDDKLRDARLKTLANFKLQHIAQHWETMDADPVAHLKIYRERLAYLASTKPLFINSQSGRDWFGAEENARILDAAEDIAAETGVRIAHETHRGKFSFCARSTADFLKSKPNLRLTADFSHWCSVSESLLEDQKGFVDAAIVRADHIHARVGHSQGPQISDPRAPEFAQSLDAHLAWWDAIRASHQERRSDLLTVCPEFGPWPYMPTLAWTMQPLASQWDINVHMMNMLKRRWNLE